MKIGGLQKCSLIDYPGKISAIVFTSGCNFRCHYCHNPELVIQTAEEIPREELFEFLTRRKNLLDAVTVTGGEPTVHADLLSFLRELKKMGFLVKLDSNGTRPDVLEAALEDALVDYIAMDIKAPLSEYAKTVVQEVDSDVLKRSIGIIMRSGIEYEFRTTVVKSLLSPHDFHGIGEAIRGAKIHYLQKFVPSKTLDLAFMSETTYSPEEFEHLRTIMLEYVDNCEIRL